MLIVKLMKEFQKKNDVTRMCVCNSFVLKTFSEKVGLSAKVKAVIATYDNYKLQESHLVIHIIVVIEDKYYDPSYDVAQHNPQYYDSLSSVLLPSFDLSLKNKLIKDYIRFLSIADTLNKGGCPSENYDTDYCNEQTNYILKSFPAEDFLPGRN